jgi:hypothetical protein
MGTIGGNGKGKFIVTEPFMLESLARRRQIRFGSVVQ